MLAVTEGIFYLDTVEVTDSSSVGPTTQLRKLPAIDENARTICVPLRGVRVIARHLRAAGSPVDGGRVGVPRRASGDPGYASRALVHVLRRFGYRGTVSSNEVDVPFDLKHIRVIYYDVTDPFWH